MIHNFTYMIDGVRLKNESLRNKLSTFSKLYYLMNEWIYKNECTDSNHQFSLKIRFKVTLLLPINLFEII